MDNISYDYVDYGFGFPVILDKVKYELFNDEYILNINYTKVENCLCAKLPYRSIKLIGNELKFIRLHYLLSIKVFSNIIKISPDVIKQWENIGSYPIDIGWEEEKEIRRKIINFQLLSSQEYERFEQHINSIDITTINDIKPIKINVENYMIISI